MGGDVKTGRSPAAANPTLSDLCNQQVDPKRRGLGCSARRTAWLEKPALQRR